METAASHAKTHGVHVDRGRNRRVLVHKRGDLDIDLGSATFSDIAGESTK